jgi:hypothetical protein
MPRRGKGRLDWMSGLEVGGNVKGPPVLKKGHLLQDTVSKHPFICVIMALFFGFWPEFGAKF